MYYEAARMEALETRGCEIYLIGGGNSAGLAAMFSGVGEGSMSIAFVHQYLREVRGDVIDQAPSPAAMRNAFAPLRSA